MEPQDFGWPQDSCLLACILLRYRRPGTSLRPKYGQDREHDHEIPHDAACRLGWRFGPGSFSPAGRAAEEPKKGGTLTFMQNNEPQTLVALTTVATPALTVSAKVTEGLLAYDYEIKPRPQLATEWSISPDGKTYTFKLRPDVKWHDGKDFTSADVAYSIELLKTIHPRGRNTFANVAGVKTPIR